MTLITVTERNGFTIETTFFSDPILLLAPDTEYMSPISAKEIAKNTLTEIGEEFNIFGEKAYEPVSRTRARDMIEHVLMEECLTKSEVENTTAKNAIDAALPTDKQLTTGLTGSVNGIVSNPGVIIHMTRLIIQNAFEQLSSSQTHLTVENPCEDHDTWNETHVTLSTTQAPDVRAKLTYAITIDSPYFEESVTMQVPENNIIAKSQAKTATENVFTYIAEDVEIRSDTFEPVETTKFASLLRVVVKEAINSVTDHNRSEDRREIQSAVDAVVPNKTAAKSLPDTIYSPGVIMHITRMALQGVYEELSEKHTNYHVDDPFKVSEHRWNETSIEKIPCEDLPEETDCEQNYEEFTFDKATAGDTVSLSTITTSEFTISNITKGSDLPVSGGNNFKSDAYALIKPNANNVSARYIVKNKIGNISVWRTGTHGGAQKNTAEKDVTIQLQPEP